MTSAFLLTLMCKINSSTLHRILKDSNDMQVILMADRRQLLVVWFLAALAASMSHASLAGRFLVNITPLCQSHMMAWKVIAAELAHQRGHKVAVGV